MEVVIRGSTEEISALVLEAAGLEVQVQGRPSPKELIVDAVNQEIQGRLRRESLSVVDAGFPPKS